MNSSKGFANVPFQWLFVLLAGGFVLFLIVMFVQGGAEVAEKQISGQMLVHFDTLFSSLSTTERTETVIESREGVEMIFTCSYEEGSIFSSFSLRGADVDRPIDDVVLFSRERISGEQIYTQTEDITVPFSVGSSMFITDTRTLFVVIDKDDIHREQLFSLLPKQIPLQEIVFRRDISEVKYKGYDTIVFISVNEGQIVDEGVVSGSSNIKFPKGIFSKNVYHLDIKPTANDISTSGEVTVYKKRTFGDTYQLQTDGEDLSYVGSMMLLGTMMSEDVDYYNCVLEKVKQRIVQVGQVLKFRADRLAVELAGSRCAAFYESASISFDDYLSSVSSLSLDNIYQKGKELEKINDQLAFGSCPVLY
jgi:hypothetical protein